MTSLTRRGLRRPSLLMLCDPTFSFLPPLNSKNRLETHPGVGALELEQY